MSSKDLPVKGLAAGVYLSEAPSPPMTSYIPLTHCIRGYLYSIDIHTEKGRRGRGR